MVQRKTMNLFTVDSHHSNQDNTTGPNDQPSISVSIVETVDTVCRTVLGILVENLSVTPSVYL